MLVVTHFFFLKTQIATLKEWCRIVENQFSSFVIIQWVGQASIAEANMGYKIAYPMAKPLFSF